MPNGMEQSDNLYHLAELLYREGMLGDAKRVAKEHMDQGDMKSHLLYGLCLVDEHTLRVKPGEEVDLSIAQRYLTWAESYDLDVSADIMYQSLMLLALFYRRTANGDKAQMERARNCVRRAVEIEGIAGILAREELKRYDEDPDCGWTYRE